MKDWSLESVTKGCERYFICESFRGLNFTLFSSFPVFIKPLQSAILWCAFLNVGIQQYRYCSRCTILWSLCYFNMSLSQKGRGSYLFLILFILFLVFPLLVYLVGGMSFLSTIPYIYLLLQFFLPCMCNYSGFCSHGGHGAHICMWNNYTLCLSTPLYC